MLFHLTGIKTLRLLELGKGLAWPQIGESWQVAANTFIGFITSQQSQRPGSPDIGTHIRPARLFSIMIIYLYYFSGTMLFLVRLITNYVLKDISAVTSLPRLSRTMSAANSSDQKVRHLILNAACCVKFWSRVSGALFDVQCHSARISPEKKLVLVLACKFGTWQTLCFRIETWVRS